jgi:hypothetical protein
VLYRITLSARSACPTQQAVVFKQCFSLSHACMHAAATR